jgi:hypothetical protein
MTIEERNDTMNFITTETRRLRWALAPITVALLVACGGSNTDEDTSAALAADDDTQQVADAPADDAAVARETAQAVTPTSFRHPGIFLTQARLDAFKAAQNSANPSVLKTGYQVVLNDPRSAYTYSHKALSNVQVVGSAIGDQEARFKNDAQGAYLNALRWVRPATRATATRPSPSSTTGRERSVPSRSLRARMPRRCNSRRRGCCRSG